MSERRPQLLVQLRWGGILRDGISKMHDFLVEEGETVQEYVNKRASKWNLYLEDILDRELVSDKHIICGAQNDFIQGYFSGSVNAFKY